MIQIKKIILTLNSSNENAEQRVERSTHDVLTGLMSTDSTVMSLSLSQTTGEPPCQSHLSIISPQTLLKDNRK